MSTPWYWSHRWGMMPQITGMWTVFQQRVQTNVKGQSRLCITGPLWGESTGDLWVRSRSARDAESFSWHDVIISLQVTSSHYCDVVMGAMASQITSLTIVYSIVHSGADQRKHQSSALPAFVGGIHRWPVNTPHIGPETRKMFLFDDVIMSSVITDPWCLK